MSSTMNINEVINSGDISVGKLVSLDYRYAGVFTKYGIDFCCGGKVSLKSIIEKKKINESELKNALNAISPESETIPAKLSLSELIDVIIREHHDYLREAIPVLQEHLTKIVKVHGGNHTYLAELSTTFTELSEELISHLKKEESILFRVIKYVEECARFSEKPRTNGYKSIQSVLGSYLEEHEKAGEFLRKINQLTSNFTPPSDACTTFRVSYMELKEFEENTFKHVHLENNILFPKAIEMEMTLGLLNRHNQKERIS